MQAKDLKQYISEDEERIISILEFYNFHSIWSNHSEIRCAAPDSDNKTAVVVKINETLFSNHYSDSSPYRGDLIGLCMEVSGQDFRTAIKNIHALLGLSLDNKIPKGQMVVSNEMAKYSRKKTRKEQYQNKNKLHDISFLNQFVDGVHKDLLSEGITPQVMKMFHIGFDPRKNRITFPHFDWIEHNKVVGVQGRIADMTSDQAKLLGVPKYWNYIKGYKKSLNLYGWSFAEPYIKKNKRLIIFEGEKSVLKQFSYERGEGYSVALGGHEISQEQVNFILKNTPVDCEIIIAFDKDIMKDEKYLIECCNRFTKYRNKKYVSYIYMPNATLFGEKDSPIDKGYKAFNALLNGLHFTRRTTINGGKRLDPPKPL